MASVPPTLLRENVVSVARLSLQVEGNNGSLIRAFREGMRRPGGGLLSALATSRVPQVRAGFRAFERSSSFLFYTLPPETPHSRGASPALAARVDRNWSLVASAHQMGTCRMGSDARSAVRDERGEVFGVKNLHVADASVFPASSGVNPMITVLALAACIAEAIDG
jgi:choline dehydrogenase-like flavoprotein